MLACPRCRSPLTAHTVTTDVEGWQVEVDACERGCGGLWLEAHDFEADAQARLLMDTELLALNRGRKDVDTAAPAHCPEGHGPMHRYDWNNENIHLDTCDTCQGRWVDGGEIARIHAQWDKEPLDAAEMAALERAVKAIKADTDKTWKEETFAQWLFKRLTFASRRAER